MDLTAYELEFEDRFDGDQLDTTKWVPYYLPHWSSRAATATRYDIGGGTLRLRIDEGQPPWCPEYDGEIRASVLQTGAFAGPVGSSVGQLHFTDGLVVTEEQQDVRLYTPTYGLVELRCRGLADPRNMGALWLMGYEDTPERSGEVLVCEIFGREIGPDGARIGMGVRPFTDPTLTDEFSFEPVTVDPLEFHRYAAEWSPEGSRFYVDGELVKSSRQAPAYPLQLMLALYEFEPGGTYPKLFEVDYVRGYRRR